MSLGVKESGFLQNLKQTNFGFNLFILFVTLNVYLQQKEKRKKKILFYDLKIKNIIKRDREGEEEKTLFLLKIS
jgi:hypothetical protein